MKQPTGPRYKPPLPAIRIGAADRPEAEMRQASWLVWYMRLLGLLWMGQGVFLWSGILLGTGEAGDPFALASLLGGSAVVFFCVLDLIAAVGLWLAAAWGGVVWLVAVSAQWLIAIALPHLFPYDRLVGIIDIVLVAGYLVLTYRAARESEPFV